MFSQQTKVTSEHSSSLPLHVRVPESMPVNVHVKKRAQGSFTKIPQMKMKDTRLRKEAGNICATARMNTKAPWIPPGKASIRDIFYKFESPTNQLEITLVPEADHTHSLLHSDLSTDEEEILHDRINQYERKIDSLMAEVGSLKNETALRKKEQLLERRLEELSASKRIIEKQEEKLEEAAKELEVTEKENALLCQSLEKIQEETDHSRLEADTVEQEKGTLLRKLVEAEVDGAAVAQQASALQEMISQTWTDQQLSQSDTARLDRQKKQLMQKLNAFEGTNCSLRKLLRGYHRRETDAIRLSEKMEMILRKLADTEAQNTATNLKVKEKEVEQLTAALNFEKENVRSAGELSKALETTRAHLQGQLCSKEIENGHLAVQIQAGIPLRMLQKEETERMLEKLQEVQQQGDVDREVLKQRAERSEDTAGQLTAQLLVKETQLADALAAAESWRSCHAQEVKEKSRLETELTVLNNQLSDLQDQLHSVEEKARVEREGLVHRLHRLTSDSAAGRLENQRLMASISSMEEKLTLSQSETQQLKTSVNRYESLLKNYKSQLQKVCLEADEYSVKAELAEKEAQTARAELDQEVGALRKDLLDRLSALESLPRMLKYSELQLREAEKQVHAHERRSLVESNTLTELRLKVEQQGCRAEALREKNLLLVEENKQLIHAVENLERKLEETNLQNRDLLQVIAKREETIHNNQLRMEEKSQECKSLARQVQATFVGKWTMPHYVLCLQVDQSRESATSRARSCQSRVLELEMQLSLTKSELTQLCRRKEEAERQLQLKLQGMKDHLEQSDSTNRSLQNYIQFLKDSYANVFGPCALTSSIGQAPLLPDLN
ncbi:outer dense fiber protein 2-like isoform X1 [Arapaima gigas]